MKRIVTVGGGTGSYTILSGLKVIPDVEITALVSMADDGGSTGVLRDELGVLPPGDVRQCLVALSEHSDIVRALMGYRFQEGGLSGHSFGNIFLAALEKVTGDFVKGVEVASEILKVSGTVVPVTKNKAELSVILKNGESVVGENAINHADLQSSTVESLLYTSPVQLNPLAERALLDADVIILGPGNYYCSLLPNVIVKGFKETLKKTTAKVIFPINLTNKSKHTLSWKASDYVSDLEWYLDRKIDIILINNEHPTEEQISLYEMEEGDGVMVIDDIQEDERVVREMLLSHAIISHDNADKIQKTRSFIRHDKHKLGQAIKKIL